MEVIGTPGYSIQYKHLIHQMGETFKQRCETDGCFQVRRGKLDNHLINQDVIKIRVKVIKND